MKQGYKHSEETKRKMSFAKKGKKMSEETCKKMSISHLGEKNPMWGKHYSEQEKKRKSEIGKLFATEEFKRKQSERVKNEWKNGSRKLPKNFSHKGLSHTEETKKRISAILKERGIKPPLLMGAKASNWQGGKSFEPYSTDWTNTLRRSVRERDYYTCQLCKEPQGDTAFDVHHINYDKKNCDPKNLITLCRNCHAKTNFNRKSWLNYFSTQ